MKRTSAGWSQNESTGIFSDRENCMSFELGELEKEGKQTET